MILFLMNYTVKSHIIYISFLKFPSSAMMAIRTGSQFILKNNHDPLCDTKKILTIYKLWKKPLFNGWRENMPFSIEKWLLLTNRPCIEINGGAAEAPGGAGTFSNTCIAYFLSGELKAKPRPIKEPWMMIELTCKKGEKKKAIIVLLIPSKIGLSYGM